MHTQVPLSELTTLKVGGPAAFVADCVSVEEIQTALAFARERGLPWSMLGGGSNLLASDAGYAGVLIRLISRNTLYEDQGNEVIATADAGVSWDAFVHEVVSKGLWRIENLAGIPGTVGAAPVQNIGAYGVEVKDAFAYAEVVDTETNEIRKMFAGECEFGYRESIFKHRPTLIILRVAFALSKEGSVRAEYKDISQKRADGASLDTPECVATVVREIRALKFPDLFVCGTAGSFFKNPIISQQQFSSLKAAHPTIPSFPAGDAVKVPLAWILDKVLNIKGFSRGHVRLFENQPLVLVTETGATAHDVDSFANHIASLVLDATGITIEREVRSLSI